MVKRDLTKSGPFLLYSLSEEVEKGGVEGLRGYKELRREEEE